MTTVSRATQEPDTIYVLPDGLAFVSPDGVGRIHYETVEEAVDEHGELPQVELDEYPAD